jgi:hypothetical protein
MFMGIQYQEYLLHLRFPKVPGCQSGFYEAKQKVLADLLHILRTLPLHLIGESYLISVPNPSRECFTWRVQDPICRLIFVGRAGSARKSRSEPVTCSRFSQ